MWLFFSFSLLFHRKLRLRILFNIQYLYFGSMGTILFLLLFFYHIIHISAKSKPIVIMLLLMLFFKCNLYFQNIFNLKNCSNCLWFIEEVWKTLFKAKLLFKNRPKLDLNTTQGNSVKVPNSVVKVQTWQHWPFPINICKAYMDFTKLSFT